MNSIIEVKCQDKIFRVAWISVFLDDMDPFLLFSMLSAQERKVAKRFPIASRAKEFAAGRYCAKEAFAKYAPATESQNVTIGTGIWGYPFIEGSDVNISIAHTDKYVMAACTSGAFPIGID